MWLTWELCRHQDDSSDNDAIILKEEEEEEKKQQQYGRQKYEGNPVCQSNYDQQ